MPTVTTVETKRKLPLLWWSVLPVLAIAAFFYIRSLTEPDVEVRVSPVTRENLVSSVSTNGKVEPIHQFQAHASGPGVVRKVYVGIGQHVKAGELLLKLDDSEAVSRLATSNLSLRTAEATLNDVEHGGSQDERIGSSGELARARLAQQQAAQSLAALQQLQAKGAASAGEIAGAQQRLDLANSTLQSSQQRSTGRFAPTDRRRAEAQLADARAAMSAARAGYDSQNVRAPFAGTVYAVPVNAYDFVPAGEGLLDLADLNQIQVRAYFDEPEIGRLAAGQAVKIVWDARPGQVWHGHIDIAPTTVITYGTRSVGECIITVDDAHGDLLPNTNVTVTVTTSQRFNVLSIPREALHIEGGVNYVFRVIGRKLVRTPVSVGVVNLTRVEIASGLTEKDTVALNATSNRDLANGLRVKPIE